MVGSVRARLRIRSARECFSLCDGAVRRRGDGEEVLGVVGKLFGVVGEKIIILCSASSGVWCVAVGERCGEGRERLTAREIVGHVAGDRRGGTGCNVAITRERARCTGGNGGTAR